MHPQLNDGAEVFLKTFRSAHDVDGEFKNAEEMNLAVDRIRNPNACPPLLNPLSTRAHAEHTIAYRSVAFSFVSCMVKCFGCHVYFVNGRRKKKLTNYGFSCACKSKRRGRTITKTLCV